MASARRSDTFPEQQREAMMETTMQRNGGEVLVSESSNESWSDAAAASAATGSTTDQDNYDTLTIRQLKSLCASNGIETRNFIERSELVEALRRRPVPANPLSKSTAPENPTLDGVVLTREQQEILATCPPPLQQLPQSQDGKLFRITAAAGTGKTTTLLHLALEAIRQGHTEITYMTFTKAAAKDGSRRLDAAIAKSSCR